MMEYGTFWEANYYTNKFAILAVHVIKLSIKRFFLEESVGKVFVIADNRIFFSGLAGLLY